LWFVTFALLDASFTFGRLAHRLEYVGLAEFESTDRDLRSEALTRIKQRADMLAIYRLIAQGIRNSKLLCPTALLEGSLQFTPSPGQRGFIAAITFALDNLLKRCPEHIGRAFLLELF
jgi:hypothetical protein